MTAVTVNIIKKTRADDISPFLMQRNRVMIMKGNIMAHTHAVKDGDARFVINPITRAIKGDSRKTKIMQYDHNSERFTFEIPKEVVGHDMSLCNKVEIHYFNIDAQTKEQKSGKYTVEDLRVEGDNVVFSWLVSLNGTQLKGVLKFLIRFKCEENGIVTYSWNTE